MEKEIVQTSRVPADTKKLKDYVLIRVVGRKITMEQFDTFDDARNKMMKELCYYSGLDLTACTEKEFEFIGKFGYTQKSAYVNDSIVHECCDWMIIKLD